MPSDYTNRIRAGPIDLTLGTLNVFKQVNKLCWLESVIVSLFLAPVTRSYVWSKIFYFKNEFINGKDTLIPVQTRFPTFDNYNIDKIEALLKRNTINGSNLFDLALKEVGQYKLQSGIYDTGQYIHMEGANTYKLKLQRLFQHLAVVMYILMEKVRQVIYDTMTFKSRTSEEAIRTCDIAIQNISCNKEFEILRYLIGCKDADAGGYVNIFSQVLKLAYNLDELRIDEQHFNPDEPKPVFKYLDITPFSLVLAVNIITGTGVYGHAISVFSDNDLSGVIRFDNEEAPPFERVTQHTCSQTLGVFGNIGKFKCYINDIFGKDMQISTSVSKRIYHVYKFNLIKIPVSYTYFLRPEYKRDTYVSEFMSSIPQLYYNVYFNGKPILTTRDYPLIPPTDIVKSGGRRLKKQNYRTTKKKHKKSIRKINKTKSRK